MSEVKAAWTNEDNFSIETTASDCIKREDAIKANENYVPYQRLGEDRQSYMDRILKELPSADVVEVVRCKDCKYWRPDTRPEDSLEDRTDGLWGWGNLCVKHLPSDECEAIEFGPEEFCNFGERKEQEHE